MIGLGASANYFARQGYYTWEMGRGLVKERGGARVMAFPQEFSVGLIAGLIEECGEAWPVVLQNCGNFWGQRQMARLDKELSAFHGGRLKSLPTVAVHASIAECLAVHGWGRVSFDMSEFDRRVLVAKLIESPVVAAVLHAKLDCGDKPVDSLMAGALAGMFSHASGVTMEGREISCVGRGDAACEFLLCREGLLGPPGAVNVLVRRRASRQEILRQVLA